ncbi:MAG: hypothetical protein JWP97_4786 [Labilithrix sp.]|nr:hypothetical protein [Labilithrix sp.]
MTNCTDHTAPRPSTLAPRGRRLSFSLSAAFALVAGAVTLLASTEASAQEWMKDRRYQEGAGIRTGNLELHPGIGAEVGYDSNYFLRTYKEGNQYVNGAPNLPVREAGLLRVTPSLSLSTLSNQRTEGSTQPQAVAFRAGIAATYREFIGVQEIRDQRNVSGNAYARLDVFQNRPVGFGVFANYQRLIQPSVVSDPNLSFNRSDVGAGAEVVALPGGGALDLRLGYQFFGAFFEESNGVPYTNTTHEISMRNRWRFRPRTALFHDTTLRFISYPNADRALNYLNNSTPLRTRLGLTGLVTDRFSVLVAAGYGATFFEKANRASTQQYDSLNAQAEATFYLSQNNGAGDPNNASLLLSTLTLGYVRDFQNSLLGNYYDSNKGYARVVYFFGGRALLQLDGYFEALGYPQPYYNAPATGEIVPVKGADGITPTGDFTNFHVGGTLFGEYRFTDAFALNATLDYSQTISDTQLQTTVTNGPVAANAPTLFDLNWRRFQALVGVRVFF